MAQIYKNGTRMMRDNFSEMELYSGSVNAPDSHYLSDNVLDWLQSFRDWSGEPICVSSTYRTKAHQLLLVEAGLTTTVNSYHMTGQAIDFSWCDKSVNKRMMKRLRKALSCPENASEVDRDFVTSMFGGAVGQIHGLGTYEWGIHIDDRGDVGANDFLYSIPVSIWDDTNAKYDGYLLNNKWYTESLASGSSIYCTEPNRQDNKKKSLLDKIFGGGGEGWQQDGVTVYQYTFWKLLLLTVLLILGYLAYRKWS